MIFCDNLGRCLFSDAWNSWNVIGRVAHQRFQINELLRCHLITFFHICRIIIFHFSTTLLCLWNANLNMLRCKLQKISVSGNNGHFHSFFFTSSGQCSKKIVSLQSRTLYSLNPHRAKDFLNNRNLLPQFVCHRLSCSFVSVIHLMTECRRMHVKCDRQIIRLFFIQNLEHDRQKSIDCIRMKSFGIRQIRKSEKCPV